MKPLVPPSWPKNLTNSWWQKNKGSATKKTGVGADIDAVQAAFKKIKWDAFDPQPVRQLATFKAQVVSLWNQMIKPVQTDLRALRQKTDTLAKSCKATDPKTATAAAAISKDADFFNVVLQLNGVFFTAVGDNLAELCKYQKDISEKLDERLECRERFKKLLPFLERKNVGIFQSLKMPPSAVVSEEVTGEIEEMEAAYKTCGELLVAARKDAANLGSAIASKNPELLDLIKQSTITTELLDYSREAQKLISAAKVNAARVTAAWETAQIAAQKGEKADRILAAAFEKTAREIASMETAVDNLAQNVDGFGQWSALTAETFKITLANCKNFNGRLEKLRLQMKTLYVAQEQMSDIRNQTTNPELIKKAGVLRNQIMHLEQKLDTTEKTLEQHAKRLKDFAVKNKIK